MLDCPFCEGWSESSRKTAIIFQGVAVRDVFLVMKIFNFINSAEHYEMLSQLDFHCLSKYSFTIDQLKIVLNLKWAVTCDFQ